jgi:GNAT superfamily N-acetyltransferase
MDDGASIVISPITTDQWDRVTRRCWPTEPSEIDALFSHQQSLGFAAWHGDRCIAQLHGYRVVLPDQPNPYWPRWTNAWPNPRWQQAIAPLRRSVPGPIWCHACCHVGRTLRSEHQVLRELIHRFARDRAWDADRTLADLNALDGVCVTREQVAIVIADLRGDEQPQFDMIESQYHSRGIGTALLGASVDWARQHGYTAVVAQAAPRGLRQYAQWAGGLPWTTYARLGFVSLSGTPEQAGPLDVDAWPVPPEVKDEACAAIKAGADPASLHPRIMCLPLTDAARQAIQLKEAAP